MDLAEEMGSFWWFLPGRAGGMGRPGFNGCHWPELSLEEGALFAWLGKVTAPVVALEGLWVFLDAYAALAAPFFACSPGELRRRLERLRDGATLAATFEAMNAKARVAERVVWEGGALRWAPNRQQLDQELALLARHDVAVIVSLIEEAPDPAVAARGFEVHHLPIDDLTPPRLEQVEAFATIFDAALARGRRLVTHCLAGVGRTTTMYLAASLVRGAGPLEALLAQVRRCNPAFQLRGVQGEFIERLAASGAA